MFGDVTGNEDEGTAYMFVRSGNIWRLRSKLIAPDAARLDGFGSSVAISGNNIFVGAEDGTVGTNGDQGSAYSFTVRPQPAIFQYDGDAGRPSLR
jgi:hypothetical protein